jgi:hypothetical protein
VCERCAAHERFIADVEAVRDGVPTAVDDLAALLLETLHLPASERAWRDIVRAVATIVADAPLRAKRGPNYERLLHFLAENDDLL